MEKITTAIKTVKEDIRLKEWSEQVAAQQASGISVQKWCDEIELIPRHIIIVCEKYVKTLLNQHQQLYLCQYCSKVQKFVLKRMIYI